MGNFAFAPRACHFLFRRQHCSFIRLEKFFSELALEQRPRILPGFRISQRMVMRDGEVWCKPRLRPGPNFSQKMA